MSSDFDIQVSDREGEIIAAAPGQTTLTVGFPFMAPSDLVVYRETAAGVRTVLTWPTGFGASGAGTSFGGTLTLAVPAAAGDRYRVVGQAAIERRTDMTVTGKYSPAALERDLDRNIIISAELRRDLGRVLRGHPLSAEVAPLSDTALQRLLTIGNGGEVAVPAADAAAAVAGVNDESYLTPFTARRALKDASFAPDIDTRGFYAPGESAAGFFATYSAKGGLGWRTRTTAVAGDGDGFSDGLFQHHIDTDTVNHTGVERHVTMALRGLVTGKYDVDTDTWQTQYKDLVGADFHAIGRVGGTERGVSGVVAGAIQYGTGIASNELAVENPAAHDQSTSMAAAQMIIGAFKAADDAGHLYRGALVTNIGHRITAGLELASAPKSGSYNGRFRNGINMAPASIEEAAINLRGTSAVGHAATIIAYDANDYTLFDRANNRYDWIVGGTSVLRASSGALDISGQTLPLILLDGNDYWAFAKATNICDMVLAGGYVGGFKPAGLYAGAGARTETGAFLTVAASTAASAGILLMAGVAPTSPVNGGLWSDGTDLFFRAGGVTYKFNKTAA